MAKRISFERARGRREFLVDRKRRDYAFPSDCPTFRHPTVKSSILLPCLASSPCARGLPLSFLFLGYVFFHQLPRLSSSYSSYSSSSSSYYMFSFSLFPSPTLFFHCSHHFFLPPESTYRQTLLAISLSLFTLLPCMTHVARYV